MAGSTNATKRRMKCSTKVKTGCATCRTRKIKCDENKPFCRKCITTGRTCDGYDSRFRISTCQLVDRSHTSELKSVVSSQLRSTLFQISPQDVNLLNRCFSTKTLFDVKLGWDEEAKQILQASVTDSPVRHALLSLRTLRADLEASGDGPENVVQQTASHHFGLQQYNMALGRLASNLSSWGSGGLKSALLCCQLFISIEQVRKNYATMAQHSIRGLNIMHEFHARPYLVAESRLVPAHSDQLPFLDVFIIKLFAAPCKFADPPATFKVERTASPACLISTSPQSVESCSLRTIVPDMRTELTRIAASTLEFLSKVSRVQSVEVALQLLAERDTLLSSLQTWFTGLERTQTEIEPLSTEPISVSFLRFFHSILKVVLLGTLYSSSDLYVELQTENDRMQNIANDICERVEGYVTCSGTSSG